MLERSFHPGPHPPRVAPRTPQLPNAGILRFKTEDFEKHIDFLPRSKQTAARNLFPKDTTGRWMMTDQNSLHAFVKTLDDHEKATFNRIMEEYRPTVKPGRVSEATAAKLKDFHTSPRFNPQSIPRPTRNTQGADLHSPLGSHAERPQYRDEDMYPPTSGWAQAKPGPGSPHGSTPAPQKNDGTLGASAPAKEKFLEKFLPRSVGPKSLLGAAAGLAVGALLLSESGSSDKSLIDPHSPIP